MTAQEIFDKVITHLRKQGKATNAGGGNTCFYRTRDGKSCAVGCLIPNEEYLPNMEGQNISGLMTNFPDTMNKLGLSPHIELLKALQWAHDVYPVEQWEGGWASLASRFDLTMPSKNGVS